MNSGLAEILESIQEVEGSQPANSALLVAEASKGLVGTAILVQTAATDGTVSDASLPRLIPQSSTALGTRTTKQTATKTRYVSLAQWEGTVVEARDDEFAATLRRIAGAAKDLQATFSIDEVSPFDRRLVRPGAVFYWSIGYEDRRSGRSRLSELTFRRLPITPAIGESMLQQATTLADLFANAGQAE